MVFLFFTWGFVLLVAMPFSLAGSAGSVDVQGIQMTIEKHLGTSETEISVVDGADSTILASSCSDQLDLPALNASVTADIDDTGSGNLRLGDAIYNIHENIEISGGISCTRMYSQEQVFVICDVPLADEEYSIALLRGQATPTSEDCFKARKRSTPETRSLRDHATVMVKGQGAKPLPHLRTISDGDTTTARSMRRRQGACGGWTGTTEPVSNPDPHQNYYLKQLSVSPK